MTTPAWRCCRARASPGNPRADRLVWGSLSRAVRAPARFDRDIRFPATPPYAVIGGPNFESEVADVVELGYRAQQLGNDQPIR